MWVSENLEPTDNLNFKNGGMMNMFNYFNDFIGLSGWENTTNIYEEPDYYMAEVRATGVKKEDIEIKFNMSGDVLLISSRGVKDSEAEKGRKWISHEFWPSRINTSLSLTKDIDVSEITAKLEDGILKIKLPKVINKSLPDSKRIIQIE